MIRTVQGRDGLGALAIVAHLDKAEASGLSRLAVRANVHAIDPAVAGKQGSNAIFGASKA